MSTDPPEPHHLLHRDTGMVLYTTNATQQGGARHVLAARLARVGA